MPFLAGKSGRADSFQARIERVRDEGFLRGAREAKLFRLSVGKVFEHQQALDWLDTMIEEGRSELADQHAWSGRSKSGIWPAG